MIPRMMNIIRIRLIKSLVKVHEFYPQYTHCQGTCNKGILLLALYQCICSYGYAEILWHRVIHPPAHAQWVFTLYCIINKMCLIYRPPSDICSHYLILLQIIDMVKEVYDGAEPRRIDGL